MKRWEGGPCGHPNLPLPLCAPLAYALISDSWCTSGHVKPCLDCGQTSNVMMSMVRAERLPGLKWCKAGSGCGRGVPVVQHQMVL